MSSYHGLRIRSVDHLHFPDLLGMSGHITGDLNTIGIDLSTTLSRAGQTIFASVEGRVSNLADMDALGYDVAVNELSISDNEIAAWLPDSLMPEYFRLPEILHSRGNIAGSKDTMDAKMNFNTSSGDIVLDLALKDSLYSAFLGLDSFSVQSLFIDMVSFDSIIGWPAPPVGLDLIADGSGFDPDSNLLADIQLRLRLLGDSLNWSEGLALDGVIDRKTFDGHISINEERAKLDMDVFGWQGGWG